MKLSHIIYKVKELHQGVEEFLAMGFDVEYGKEKNPYNAIIYFSEGPYLEILGSTGMPRTVKQILRIFGQGKFADRLDYWDNHPGGPCGLALENYKTNLDAELTILKKYNQSWFTMPSKRDDTKGRKLRFTCAFPNDIQLPFLMTYFNIDPKPKAFIHPNGAVNISSVSFGTKKEFIPLIKELCDDDRLKLFAGEGVGDIHYKYSGE
ncbi:hypothetical protein OXPF_34340 [Oxobacter pfennigii]|uniref:Glyoxalase-like domain-containing protein n=1 Tax=Oxobacter pfennigii TaxID=36849 RepID=A0A0P8WXD5_9CLOT|nr:VOC family protein [Oxobacter pfennigii]KPU43003.1 hypothetical protein OXPF_34340 [Oxobacter pfennigii]